MGLIRLGRGRKGPSSSTLRAAGLGAALVLACGGPDPIGVATGGSDGGFGGVAGTFGQSGSGAQTTCPPEPSGRIPRCSYGYIDADGDGYGDPARPHFCCGNDGLMPLLTDCDDTDPTRALGAYPDADGDGRGAGAPICSGDPPPAGFSFPSGDCNDHDRNVDWAATPECPCERFLFDTVVPTNPDCATAPDLLVIDHEVCNFNCGQWLAFRIGNAGGVAAQGPITVSMTVRNQQATFELEPLGPGQASGWRRVPFLGFTGPATISVVSPESACPRLSPSFEVELSMSCMP